MKKTILLCVLSDDIRSFKVTQGLSIKNAKSLSHVAIGSNCFIEASGFDLENSSQLTYLHIDNNSFANVTSLDLTGISILFR